MYRAMAKIAIMVVVAAITAPHPTKRNIVGKTIAAIIANAAASVSFFVSMAIGVYVCRCAEWGICLTMWGENPPLQITASRLKRYVSVATECSSPML